MRALVALCVSRRGLERDHVLGPVVLPLRHQEVERADALEQVARLTAQRDRARDVADGLVEVYKCPLQQKVKEAFNAYDAERESR